MTKNNLEYLTKKHKELHDKIEVLEAENAPDLYIQNLKKEKLHIKDMINCLE